MYGDRLACRSWPQKRGHALKRMHVLARLNVHCACIVREEEVVYHRRDGSVENRKPSGDQRRVESTSEFRAESTIGEREFRRVRPINDLTLEKRCD